jgi:hypothetical protein
VRTLYVALQHVFHKIKRHLIVKHMLCAYTHSQLCL